MQQLLELLKSSVMSLPNLETNLVKYIQTLSKETIKTKLDGVARCSSCHLTETKLAPRSLQEVRVRTYSKL